MKKDNKSARVSSYDLMRGLAILGVILAHVSEAFPTGSSHIDLIETYGRFGVQLFFFISALTMCLMWERRAGEESRVWNFYVRRFMRIAPLFWIAIWVYCLPSTPAWQVISTAAFLHGFTPESINSVVPGGWSIAVEMTFYAVFPLIAMCAGRNAKTYMLLGFGAYLFNAFAVSPLVYMIFGSMLGTEPILLRDFLYMNFFHQLPVFLMGCSIYHLGLGKIGRFSIGVLVVWAAISTLRLAFHIEASMERMTLMTIFMFFVVLMITRMEIHPKLALVFQTLGKQSYGIYLSHFMIIGFCSQLLSYSEIAPSGLLINLAMIVLATVLSYLAALILHSLVDRAGHRITQRLVVPPQETPA